MNTMLARRAAALVATVASLALMATPASATTTHSSSITGGTLEFFTSTGSTGITNSDLPLAGTVGTECGSSLFVEEDGATGSFDVVGFSSVGRFSLGTVFYVAEMKRLSSTSGTFSGGAITSETLALRVDIFTALNQTATSTTCLTGTRVCRYNVTVHLTGTYTGWTPSSNVQLAGTASVTLAIGSCQVPFGEYNGGTASIAPWSFHLTT